MGEHDAAIDQLTTGLPTSSPTVTRAWLSLDPAWDPLRGNQHFARLLSSRR